MTLLLLWSCLVQDPAPSARRSLAVPSLATAPVGSGALQDGTAKAGDRARLETILSRIEAVDDLEQRRLMTRDDAEKARAAYLADAAAAARRPSISVAELRELIKGEARVAGFGTFLDIITVVAALLLCCGVIWLLGRLLWPYLKEAPLWVIEVLVWALVIPCCALGWIVRPFMLWKIQVHPLWFVLAGAFALPGVVQFSVLRHLSRIRGGSFAGPFASRISWIVFGTCTVLWGAMAVLYHRAYPEASIPYVLAFMTVMALESAIGFSSIFEPGAVAIGWEKPGAVPRSLVASFVILVAYIAISVNPAAVPPEVALFRTGALFMGAFVFYLALLVMASRWYPGVGREGGSRRVRYWTMQVVTVLFGLAALYGGSSRNLPTLLGIGGTFFFLYLMEKYFELPWKKAGWAVASVLLAIGLYFFAGFAGAHPEYFLWGATTVDRRP